jgi:excisionase family DNA binding protein
MDKLLLKPAEVSELTGMGKSKTYELIAAGILPSVRIGRLVRVPADKLRRWVEELQGGADSESAMARPINNRPTKEPDAGNPIRSAIRG